MKYEVAIIILNFNSNRYTIDCVKSIINHTSQNTNYEIIVVDNGSKEVNFRKLSSEIKQYSTSLIRSEVNLGYSGGLQVGVNHSNSEFFFFLNNDCLFLNDAVTELLHFYKNKKKAGIIGGQIFDEHLKPRRSFGYQPTFLVKALGHQALKAIRFGKYPSRKKIYTAPVEVPVISGSAMFISRKVLEDIGGLDYNYFLYCEEEDLAIRVNRHKYSNYLVPTARYLHYQGKSSGVIDKNILKKQVSSLKYFYTKNYSRFYQKSIFTLMLLIHLIKSLKVNTRSILMAQLIWSAKGQLIKDIKARGMQRLKDIDNAIRVH